MPEPGIVFKDIMPLLADPDALRQTIDLLGGLGRAERKPDVVIGGEARGFFIGSALAYKLGCGFVAARRPGQAAAGDGQRRVRARVRPRTRSSCRRTRSKAGTRVLIHDDVLATGRTSKAMAELVEQLGGEVVGMAFLIELDFLKGREQLAGLRRFLADSLLSTRLTGRFPSGTADYNV